MTHNTYLKVFVANGLLLTWRRLTLTTRYTFDHMGLPADLRTKREHGYYGGGHMICMRTNLR